ncbi:hypothetical protein McanCB56680_003387 [Microsporum canis]|uniref:MOSC domain-containing protein n=1 Tax=Arthroderma otae (strain ATCC MYA-4605 / CBS 113480) TaxID=554155 RepID=C5FFK3_ARTOC|nr:MOSC domain-containing protein [Microsporum canis CBS 113480]EEQ29450.1 MOSC domain-containing protein [Microsporum canis CBS 113480]
MRLLRGIVPRLNLPVPVALALVYILFVFPLVAMLYFELKSRRERARTPKGCRKLGLHDNHSNLSDEHEYGTDGLKRGSSDKTPRIKALVVYPIKSCRGIEFNRAEFKDSGLAWDRQFCFAEYTSTSTSTAEEEEEDGGRWDAKTLRDGKYSRMALIRPEIWVPDPSSETYDARLRSVKSGGILIVYFPRDTRGLPPWTRLAIALGLADGEEYFSVPLNPPAEPSSVFPLEPLRLFTVPTKATRYTTHVPAALGAFLECKKPLGLFRVHPEHSRVAVGNAPSAEELGFVPRMAFSDQYPLQVQSMGSVREMDGRTKYAIPHLSVRRFRPNVVVEGVAAYEEDAWKMVRLVKEGREEEVDVHVCCRTVRCKLPNVDPDTGERHGVEPDKTLRGTRAIDGGAKGGCLGMMLVPTKPHFTISVGDEVKVLSTGEHFFRAK